MKKPKRSHVVFLAVLMLLAAAALWYVFPRTADDLFPELDWAEAAVITANWSRYEANPEKPTALCVQYDGAVPDLPAGSEAGKAVLGTLRKMKLRRSLLDLISGNVTHTHPTQPGDVKLYMEVKRDNGSLILRMEFWFDRIFWKYPGENNLVCFTADQSTVTADLLAALQPLTAETRTER